MGCPIRSSQSKGASSVLEGRVFRWRMNLSYSEGGRLGMLMTWLEGASLSWGRVGLTRDFTSVVTSSIIGWRGCIVTGARDASPSTKGVRLEGDLSGGTTKGGVAWWEIMGVSEFEGLLGEPHAYGISTVTGHKQVRWLPSQVLQRNLGLRLRHLGFSMWLAGERESSHVWWIEARDVTRL